ncbi:MAG: GFA family protein [Gammaproteobacteria bacterium]
MSEITGGCLCGSVRYELNGPITSVGHCHCTMCQRYHGTAYSTYAMVPKLAYRLTQGAASLQTVQTSPQVQRKFCASCGSPISYENDASGENIWITAGSLDEEPDCNPQYHIFVKDKVSWLEINDNLPQYPEFPPEH